jgi:hypothetical protein
MTFRNRRYHPLVLMCSVLLMCSLSLFEAPAAAGSELDAVQDGQHDFDFDFGVWKTHSSRLLHPLTGSTIWADMDGITVVKKVGECTRRLH